MTFQAIPTSYAGMDFRSRLEADYATTFDGISLPWQYEPEGFQLSDGTWYSPDFYLPSARAWLVKGDHEEGINKVEQFAADLWEAAGQPEYDSPDAPMVILSRPAKALWFEVLGHDTPSFLGVRGSAKATPSALLAALNAAKELS